MTVITNACFRFLLFAVGEAVIEQANMTGNSCDLSNLSFIPLIYHDLEIVGSTTLEPEILQ